MKPTEARVANWYLERVFLLVPGPFFRPFPDSDLAVSLNIFVLLSLIHSLVFFLIPHACSMLSLAALLITVSFVCFPNSFVLVSTTRQFNPLNPPGVGWLPLPQTNMAAVVGRARSCAVVRAWSVMRGRARSVVRGRAWSCVVVRGSVRRPCVVVRGRARSCVVVRGRAWSCVVVRGSAWSCVVVRGRAWSCVVVHGRAWSCAVVRGRACVVGHAWSCVVGRARSYVVVRGRAWSCRSARFAASTAVTQTNERTTSNNPLNPPGWGGSIFLIFLR